MYPSFLGRKEGVFEMKKIGLWGSFLDVLREEFWDTQGSIQDDEKRDSSKIEGSNARVDPGMV